MKIKVLLLVLTLTSCLKINSQQNNNCSVFLDPILKIDLSVDANKSDILKYLDESTQLSEEDLKWTPKNIDIYIGYKKITLPNGFVSDTKFSLRFRDEKLVGYKAFIAIGENYKYFWELIELIKKLDKSNSNRLLYQSEKKLSYNDLFNNKDCKRMISVQRSRTTNEYFEIKIAMN
jgi:hypothetical protein